MNNRLWIAIPVCVVAALLAGAIAFGVWTFVRAPSLKVIPVTPGETEEAVDIGLTLPGGALSMRIQQILIQVRADGSVVVDGNSVAKEELGARFSGIQSQAEKEGVNLMVVLSVDAEAKERDFSAVLEKLNEAGIESVTLTGFEE